MSVLSELQAKQAELEAEKKTILEARDAEIAAARQKYAQGSEGDHGEDGSG